MERVDLIERAKRLGVSIIRLCRRLPNERVGWIVADQMMRAGLSIGANLAESRGCGSRLDFKRFQEVALKSAKETFYWLDIMEEAHLVEGKDVMLVKSELDQMIKMIAAGVLKLKRE